MKNQALFSSKDKNKKLKCRLLQYLFGTLRVNIIGTKMMMTLQYPVFFNSISAILGQYENGYESIYAMKHIWVLKKSRLLPDF